MQTFRFMVETGDQAKILAGEEALLDSVSSGSDPILRFVIFDPTSVLLGYHQAVEDEVNIDEVRRRGWEIGRRPTGGGTIIMGPEQLGWEIYTNSSLVGYTPEEAMRKMGNGVIEALEQLGVKARFRPKNDVEVNGRKISGIGAFSFGQYMAITGTILLDFDVDSMVSVLKLSSEKIRDKVISDFRERVTWINREIGKKIEMQQLISLARKSFSHVLSVDLEDGEYNQKEIEEISNLKVKYSSPSWIYDLRKSLNGDIRFVQKKFPGGLVKVQVKKSGNLIESILITGDFFVEPRRAIFDLESRLKWSKSDEVKKEIEDWYNGIKIIGIPKEGLVNLVEEAIR
ncbi:lipoate--protein ligase family protein [Acidianus sp. RZ1]|uniref:lipoyl protein ligase domain-containing protein n=1 Tax=Acidianus sp. RZ1 TaxID=1540082 RepID=UPI001492E2DF|nr:lipoate--protein ligase family protein [Acidianus sp. RZ1]NON63579.1 lipoate--protein ligase family protein [Acidianus sp. RZ1]